jgi:hypothetical protein
MSKEDFNHEDKNAGDQIPSKEQFISEYLKSLEKGVAKGNEIVIKTIFDGVSPEFKEAAIKSYDMAKEELKNQFFLRAEVMVEDYHDNFWGAYTQSIKQGEKEGEAKKLKHFEEMDALRNELKSGLDLIVRDHSQSGFENAKRLMNTLKDSIDERGEVSVRNYTTGLKEMTDRIIDERERKMREMSLAITQNFEDLAAEFWVACTEKAKVIAEEFKA